MYATVIPAVIFGTYSCAPAEEAEAFAGVKRKAGGQPRTDADGNVIQSGGGNRQKSGKKKAEPEAEAEEVAEAEAEEVAEAEADPTEDDLLGDI